MNIRVLKTNGQEVILKPEIHKDGNKTIVSISKEIVGEAEYVDFLYDYFNACEKKGIMFCLLNVLKEYLFAISRIAKIPSMFPIFLRFIVMV